MSSNDRAKQVDFAYNTGMRQDLESMVAPVGTLNTISDLEFDKLNRLIRRDGFTTMGVTRASKTNVIDFPVERILQTPRGERLMFTNKNAFLHYPVPNAVSEAGLDQQTSTIRATMESAEALVGDEVGAIYSCDCAQFVGAYVVAYLQQDVSTGLVNCYVDVLDTATNGRVITHANLGPANQLCQPRVVACGGSTSVFVLWVQGVNIKYVKLNFGALPVTVPASANLVTDVNTAVFDVDTMVSGFCLVYSQTTPRARIITVDVNGAITNSFNWLANGGVSNWTPSALGIHGNNLNANEVRAVGFDSGTSFVESEITTAALVHTARSRLGSGLPGALDATQMTTIAANSTGSYVLFSNYTSTTVATNPRGHLYIYKLTVAGGLVNLDTYANYSLAAKCYIDLRNNCVHGFARFDDPSGLQSHILMLDFGVNTGSLLAGPLPVMHFGSGRVPLQADNAITGIGGTADFGLGAFRMAFPLNIGTSSISGNQVASYAFQSYSTQRFLSTPANNELHIGGATPLSYDGQRIVENSFYSYPILKAGNITTSNAGGFMPQGIYSYSAVYEWTDALGNRHQSPPCPSVTVDMSGGSFAGGTNSVFLTFPCYHPTRKQVPVTVTTTVADQSTPVRVIVYRSQSNGTILYRMPIASVNNTGSAADNTVINDVYADATISVNEILYAGPQGRGELATSAPPPSKVLTTHAQRVWGVDGENQERIWCTKTLETQVNPGYNAGLQILIPGAGKINGLAGQDGKLYALATNGVYLASYGDGIDNAGGGAFPSPQLITASVNCTEPRSVIVATNGIYFLGDDRTGKGIYQIRRGDAEPVAIGQRMRDMLALYPVCRGVTDRVDKSRIEFLMVDSDGNPTTSDSRIFYYHYDYLDENGIGAWTVARPGGAMALQCIGQWLDLGRPATVIANQAAYAIQQPGTVRDFGIPPSTTIITTNDVRPFGLLGYGRICGVTVLNSGGNTPEPLKIEASYDGGFSWPDSFVFPVYTESTAQPIIRRWDTPTSKLPAGGSVRLRLTDPPADGESISGNQYFHGLSIEVEPLGGNARLSNVQRG